MLKRSVIIPVLLVSLSTVMFSYRAQAFVVCLVPDFPFDICPYPNATSDYFSTDVFGFDVEMFRYVAGLAGWVEDETAASAPPESGRYVFRCLYNFLWGQVTTSMVTPTQAAFDHCAAAIGDFTINTARLQAGGQFSTPYMSTGLGLMVLIQKEAYDWWAFINPFDGMVWLCYGLIALIVPSCVWVVERLNTVGYVSLSHDSLVEWKDSTYQTLLAVFNIAVLKVYSFPSQILIIVFLFTNLIVVATYTANLAAALTSGNYLTTSLTDPSQLYGATVGTYASYVDRVYKHYAGTVLSFDGTSLENMLNAMAYMRNGSISAYLYDRTTLQRLLPLYDPLCEFELLDGVVEPFNYGVFFHELFNHTVLQQFSNSVVAAMQDDTISNLQTKYMPAYSTCAVTTSNSVVLQQLAGLFIILACTIALSLLWTAFNVFLRIRTVIRAESGDLCEAGKATMSRKPSYAEVLKDVFISANRDQTFVPMSSKRARANSVSIAGRSFSRSSKVNPDFTSSNSMAQKSFNQKSFNQKSFNQKSFNSTMPAPVTRNSTLSEQPSTDQLVYSPSVGGRVTIVGSGGPTQVLPRSSMLSEQPSTDQITVSASLAGRSVNGGNAVPSVARTSTLSEQPSENYSGSLAGLRSMNQGSTPMVPKSPKIADKNSVEPLLIRLGKDEK